MGIDTREVTLVGETFGNRQELIRKYVDEKTKVILRREPDNQYDPNAISVEVETPKGSQSIGYIPRKEAEWIAKRMDAGCHADGLVYAVFGGTPDKPNRGVVIVAAVERLEATAPKIRKTRIPKTAPVPSPKPEPPVIDTPSPDAIILPKWLRRLFNFREN